MSQRVAGLGRNRRASTQSAQCGKGVDVPAPTYSYHATFDRASEEKLNPPCPKCGGETAVQRWLAHECSVGCDTSQRHCVECDWLGDPE